MRLVIIKKISNLIDYEAVNGTISKRRTLLVNEITPNPGQQYAFNLVGEKAEKCTLKEGDVAVCIMQFYGTVEHNIPRTKMCIKVLRKMNDTDFNNNNPHLSSQECKGGNNKTENYHDFK